jgi:hypothetical protein
MMCCHTLPAVSELRHTMHLSLGERKSRQGRVLQRNIEQERCFSDQKETSRIHWERDYEEGPAKSHLKLTDRHSFTYHFLVHFVDKH